MQELKITNLTIQNFKNYQNLSLDFTEKIICFTGNNGQGKTNLLDAIYYICLCKSFLNSTDSQSIHNQQPYFTITANIELNKIAEHFYCAFKRDDRKIFRRNKKEYDKLSDHIGLLPLVLMSPADTFILHDGSESRRKLLDGIISQFNPQYLRHLQQYTKALLQRNALLKSFAENRNFQTDLLELWDIQLSELGTKIYQSRHNFISNFTSTFLEYYKLLAPENELVELIYESHLHESNFDNLLKVNIAKDCASTHTTHGIHKDDLIFLMNGRPLKKAASQGQQKTFLTALRLAQFQYLKSTKNKMPILLIDDIYDKLDPSRVKQLLNLVSSNQAGQVFITDTNYQRIINIFNDIRAPYQLFLIEDGQAKQIN